MYLRWACPDYKAFRPSRTKSKRIQVDLNGVQLMTRGKMREVDEPQVCVDV
ncbi:MAG: hypothetical protein ACPIOQ_27345 [Promethearchaeia archaeon]